MKLAAFSPAILVVSLALAAPALRAADAKPKPATYLTEEEARAAGPDFDLQGEFAGGKLGAQVIALGNDTFRVVFHKGGLPGAGWDKSPKVEIESKSDGDKVEFGKDAWKATLTKDAVTGEGNDGKFTLKKVRRTSPTLGAKPPAGAVVLFDGSNADAWAGGHLDELGRHLLAAGTKSKEGFTDFTLHVEFLLPFKPLGRGQDRANSGVYLQDRYEVQVLDSFGLKGANNECGGIYSKTAPSVNMCFPPLVWQTYDIEFTAAKFDAEGKKTANAVATVRHNGVLIHDHVEIAGPTGGGQPEKPTPGPIQLQGHGNPVVFRNVWLVKK